MDYNRAVQFIKDKHKGQLRIGGDEYVSHPIAVSEIIKNKGLSQEMIFTALFHDLLEDTDATENEILNLSCIEVLEAVKLLTKYEGYDINEYISNIKDNEIALHVKLADRIHNLDSAIVANDEFKYKYILETERYYIPISKGTIFKHEITESLLRLKNNIKFKGI